ncbi:hypothetical protein D0T08_23480 [Emticicia sp. C21]|nr:hypothetical protein D0T08_23480 [Emticicia sp. C21]
MAIVITWIIMQDPTTGCTLNFGVYEGIGKGFGRFCLKSYCWEGNKKTSQLNYEVFYYFFITKA